MISSFNTRKNITGRKKAFGIKKRSDWKKNVPAHFFLQNGQKPSFSENGLEQKTI
jgi:hypothetical protein